MISSTETRGPSRYVALAGESLPKPVPRDEVWGRSFIHGKVGIEGEEDEGIFLRVSPAPCQGSLGPRMLAPQHNASVTPPSQRPS